MRTLLFVLSALSAVGLADASQVIVLGNEPEEARPSEPLPEPYVIVDPICAFDGSGCLPETAQPQEALVGETPPAAEPQPATAQASEPAPAQTEEARQPTASGNEGP